MTRPLGVILAGGQATRMGGGDKSLLPLGGQSLLARVSVRLAPQVGAVALNANGDPLRFSAYGLTVLPDSIAGFPGPLAGVMAGLDWDAEQGALSIVTVAADTPFFPLTSLIVCRPWRRGKPIRWSWPPPPARRACDRNYDYAGGWQLRRARGQNILIYM